MRRPVGVKKLLPCSTEAFSPPSRHCRHPSIRTLDERSDSALSPRNQSVEDELQNVALDEGRSISQVCEALLNGALDNYKKEGSAKFAKIDNT